MFFMGLKTFRFQISLNKINDLLYNRVIDYAPAKFCHLYQGYYSSDFEYMFFN